MTLGYRDKLLAKEITKQLKTNIEIKNGRVIASGKDGKATLDYGQGVGNTRTRGLF